jgi:hypothetical protein
VAGTPPPDREWISDARGVPTSGPPCPKCRFAMDPGYLSLDVASATTARFGRRDPDPVTGEPGADVETLLAEFPGYRPGLRGYRCTGCRPLELRY